MLGRSLRKRVLTALVSLSILPLFISAYQGYHCGRMAVMDLMRQHVISVAEAREALVAHWFLERVRDTAALVSPPELPSRVEAYRRDHDPNIHAALLETLRAFQLTESAYESLMIVDPEWRTMVSTGDGVHSAEELTEPDFCSGVESATEVYFGEAHAHGTHGMGSHSGRPIKNGEGKTVGYLVANLNLTASLTPLLQERSGLGHTGTAYVLDSHLRRVAASNGESIESKSPFGGAHSILPEKEAGNARTYQFFSSGDAIGVAVPLEWNEGWLVVELGMDEAMTPVTMLLTRATLLVVAVLFAVLLVSMWISHLLGRPLSKLADIAHRISEGHSAERLEPMHLQEAEEVRCAFNRMLDELQEKERLIVRSATLAIVGELTSRVVHEMRNPLSSVKMNLQALAKSHELDMENQELAGIALGQVLRLENMLNELLQYGRPLNLSPRSVRIDALFKLVSTELHGIATERGVVIDTEVSIWDASLNVDVDQFSRVLSNLVKNAIEASAPGSTVALRARAARTPGHVLIEVLDDGAGISPDHQKLLFKPFFTTKRDGTGLGLANVKKIVELHAGNICVTSAPGAGTAFGIDMPREAMPIANHTA